jgi:hypothetical protein
MAGLRHYLIFGDDVSEPALAAQLSAQRIAADSFAITARHYAILVPIDLSATTDEVLHTPHFRLAERLSRELSTRCLCVASTEVQMASAAAVFAYGACETFREAGPNDDEDYDLLVDAFVREFIGDTSYDSAMERLDEAWETGQHAIGEVSR